MRWPWSKREEPTPRRARFCATCGGGIVPVVDASQTRFDRYTGEREPDQYVLRCANDDGTGQVRHDAYWAVIRPTPSTVDWLWSETGSESSR